MTQKTTRPPKVRALEKLQKILSYGWRDDVTGYEQFFWRNGIAVLRRANDLGASETGSLMLQLGPKNTILSVEYDDAGPSWDCNDEHSLHWVRINQWATETLRNMLDGLVAPRAAEKIFYSHRVNDPTDLNAKTHSLMRDMAMAQWRGKPALKSVVERLLPDGLSPKEWLNRAQYLSEALIMEKPEPCMEFTYKEVAFNSNCMVPWLVLATFEAAQRHQEQDKALESEKNGMTYTRAKILCKEERTETLYDWRVYLHPETYSDLFGGPFHVRVALESEFSIFNHVRAGPRLLQMSALERVQCIKTLYDIVSGHELPLAPQQAYALDCERLVTIKKSGAIEQMSGTEISNAIRVIANEWWQMPGSQGHEMLNSMQGLYPWEQMKRSTPREALCLLADMGALVATPESGASLDANGVSLFEPN